MKDEIKEETVLEEDVHEEEVEEEEILEEKDEEEEFVQVKKSDLKRSRKEKRLISKVLNIILWVVLIGWAIIVVTDYLNINKDKEPKFCWFNEKVTKYDDGEVIECTGLGYKVIKYNRTSFKAKEFGPFWIKDRSNK